MVNSGVVAAILLQVCVVTLVVPGVGLHGETMKYVVNQFKTRSHRS